MEPLLRLKNFHLQRVSTLGPLDQQASALRTELSELLIIKENSERLGSLEVKNTPRNTSARTNTIELQWLEHLWDYENVFESGVVRANEG